MHTWFPHASLIWATRTSYDHKHDFKICKSNIIGRIPLGITFENDPNFGPSMTHEV